MIECAIRFRRFTSRLDRFAEILDDRGLITDILKDVLHIGTMYYPHFSSVVDPGDIAITYSKGSASVINIASLVDHVIIKRRCN